MSAALISDTRRAGSTPHTRRSDSAVRTAYPLPRVLYGASACSLSLSLSLSLSVCLSLSLSHFLSLSLSLFPSLCLSLPSPLSHLLRLLASRPRGPSDRRCSYLRRAAAGALRRRAAGPVLPRHGGPSFRAAGAAPRSPPRHGAAPPYF